MFVSVKSVDRDQHGATMMELLVVLAVIAVIAGFALMQRGSANVQLKRQNVAQELKTAFERARFDSVKRRADSGYLATVTVTPNSYTLRTYRNDANGTPTASDQVSTLPSGIVIGRYDGTSLTTMAVSFDKRGETPASPAPQFYVCNASCSSPNNTNANIVLVTPTGTVNLLPGGTSLPAFGVPAMTNVSTSTGINPDAVVP
jgi:prepilin-type N-terminal cleavage/methylation domain-containing protein